MNKEQDVPGFDNTSILIVEDSKEWGEFIKMSISRIGYSCEIAHSLREALSFLVQKEYKLAIVDLYLTAHKREGDHIIEILDKAEVKTRVIVLSAYMNALEDKKLFSYSRVSYVFDKAGFSSSHFSAIVKEIMESP